MKMSRRDTREGSCSEFAQSRLLSKGSESDSLGLARTPDH